MTEKEYEKKIKRFDFTKLSKLWRQILLKNTPDWAEGMALQYLIIRAFEIEKNKVVYPYRIPMPGSLLTSEQIDGVVYLKTNKMPVLIESKDHEKDINISPIDTLQRQLTQRPKGTIAAIFSATGFTDATLYKHSSCQETILLWEMDDIDYCISKKCFTKGMMAKYERAVEHGVKRLDLKTHFKKRK